MNEINHLSPDFQQQLNTLVTSYWGDFIPACSICAISRGDVVLNQSWGWIDPEARQTPAAVDSLFDLASVTKLFTASAFLAHVSAGKVALDDALVAVIPEFGVGGARSIDGGVDPHTKQPLPMLEGMQGRTVDPAKVTFRHLLTHTSGLAAWRDVYNAAGDAPLPPTQVDPVSPAERWRRGLSMIAQAPFVSEPGEIVRYSDLGLMLLGESVARLNNSTLDAAIYELSARLEINHVRFRPLDWGYGLNSIAPTEDDPLWRGRRVWGEVHDENACGVGGVAGHAGLFGNAFAVAQLGQAWLNHDACLNINVAVMDEAIREQAVTDGERRGLGWMLKSHVNSSASDFLSADSYGHTGFTGTSLWIDPEKQLVVACLTNSVYLGRANMNTHGFRRGVNGLLAQL